MLSEHDLTYNSRFLLTRLHLESLVNKMTPAQVRIALKILPKGNEPLSIAYNQAMRKIVAQRPAVRDLAQKALGWRIFAKRLLSVDELRYAIAVQHETFEFDEDDLSDIYDIVSACGGLIIVDQGKDTYTMRLVHYSTQEYLRPAEETDFPDARRDLALSCLTYLLYDRFEEV